MFHFLKKKKVPVQPDDATVQTDDSPTTESRRMPWGESAYKLQTHGKLLFSCRVNYATMRSLRIYRNGNVLCCGENEAFNYGAAMVDKDVAVTEISKSVAIDLLEEEIMRHKRWLEDAISKQESERENSIREGLAELYDIYDELSLIPDE